MIFLCSFLSYRGGISGRKGGLGGGRGGGKGRGRGAGVSHLSVAFFYLLWKGIFFPWFSDEYFDDGVDEFLLPTVAVRVCVSRSHGITRGESL